MPLKTLSLESLGDVQSGFLRYVVDEALRKVSDDLNARPGLKASRKVIISMEFVPVVGATGACIEAKLKSDVRVKVPSEFAESAVRLGSGGFEFRPDAPEDVNQKTFADANADEERRK